MNKACPYNDFDEFHDSNDRCPAMQARPSVAKLRSSLSLRTRLALLITLAVAIIIGVQAIIEISIFERTVERDLLETARLTAVAVADDFELRRDPLDIDSLATMLHEFAVSAPAIRTVSIISITGDQTEVVASTSSGEREEALTAARRAVGERQTVVVDGPRAARWWRPRRCATDRAEAAAVVTVSLGSLAQLRTKGGRSRSGSRPSSSCC